MRKHLTLAAVAALAIGGFNFAARAADENPSQPQPGQSNAENSMGGTTRPSGEQASGANVQVPPGIETSRTQTDSAVRSTLANIADAAITKGGLTKLASYITQARTSNIGDLSKLEDSKLNQAVDKINTEWKNKYGKSFEATASAYTGGTSTVRILMGEITNPTMLSNWPLPAKGEQGGTQDQTGGAAHGGEQALKGTDVAIVVFPQEHNLPEVTASLIKQNGTWKVEIPENINGQEFHNNLVNHLNEFANMSWPQDQNEAYRMLTHHVLASLYNVQPQGGTGGGMQH